MLVEALAQVTIKLGLKALLVILSGGQFPFKNITHPLKAGKLNYSICNNLTMYSRGVLCKIHCDKNKHTDCSKVEMLKKSTSLHFKEPRSSQEKQESTWNIRMASREIPLRHSSNFNSPVGATSPSAHTRAIHTLTLFLPRQKPSDPKRLQPYFHS